MGRLIIEILIVMEVSSFAFVLGAIFGASSARRDREESITKELMSGVRKIETYNSELPDKNFCSALRGPQ